MRRHLHPRALIRAALALSIAGLLGGSASALAARDTETVYFQGHTAEINAGAAVQFDASAGLLDHAAPIFILGFPVAEGTTGPITLPSGYQPQHNGFPPSPIPYHDHLITAVPGLGTSGTAGEYGAPRRVVEMRYSRSYAYSLAFVPITSADQIPAAEATGELQLINPGAPDPYQIWTTTVLVRPVLPNS